MFRRELRTRMLMFVWGGVLLAQGVFAANGPDVEGLIASFPSLDEMESRLGGRLEKNLPVQERGVALGKATGVAPHQASASDPLRFLTAPPAGQESGETGGPLTVAYAGVAASQAEVTSLAAEIRRLNNRASNKYFTDRLTFNARTDYGTAITGLFVNGLGFGSQTASFKQSYMAGYSLPLLARYQTRTDWKRVLSGWQISSAVGVEPNIADVFDMQRFLRGLHLSWSVAFTYDLSGATVRKIRDRQFKMESDWGAAARRAAEQRDELLKRMTERVDAMGRPVVRDTRLESLREIYPQYELHLNRYRLARSCEERMEHFFTMKGVALSLLTLAGYDRTGASGQHLIDAWKSARQFTCELERTGADASAPAQ